MLLRDTFLITTPSLALQPGVDDEREWWAVDVVDGVKIGMPRSELLAGVDYDVAKALEGGAGSCDALIANMVYCHDLFFEYRAIATDRGLTVPIVPEIYVGNSKREFDKRYTNEGFYAPAALRKAIDAAASDKQV